MSDDYRVPLDGAASHPDVATEAREAKPNFDPDFEDWLADRADPPRVVRVGELRPGYHWVQGLDLAEPSAYHPVVMVSFDDPPLTSVVSVSSHKVTRTYAPSDRVWTMDPAEVSDMRYAHHDAMTGYDPPDPRDYL